jgi:hypothetical protein
MRTIGGSFGSAIATAILAGSVAADGGLPTEGAYTAAFAFSAAAGLLAFVAALLVPRQPAALGSPAGVARRGGHALEHPADAG